MDSFKFFLTTRQLTLNEQFRAKVHVRSLHFGVLNAASCSKYSYEHVSSVRVVGMVTGFPVWRYSRFHLTSLCVNYAAIIDCRKLKNMALDWHLMA
jgi:hypothetical protein